MILKEKEFCEFITSANKKAFPAAKTGDENFVPNVMVMQLQTGTGFSITAEVNGVRASLGSVRNDFRRFATIDSAASFLKKLNVVSFKVANLGW